MKKGVKCRKNVKIHRVQNRFYLNLSRTGEKARRLIPADTFADLKICGIKRRVLCIKMADRRLYLIVYYHTIKTEAKSIEWLFMLWIFVNLLFKTRKENLDGSFE
ncbi:MAG TPA: hypothetical protein DEP42_01590 [Ruminococcaceae bacterium]|nr:hypothetical protein [Oscillospiraceae bacterium]